MLSGRPSDAWGFVAAGEVVIGKSEKEVRLIYCCTVPKGRVVEIEFGIQKIHVSKVTHDLKPTQNLPKALKMAIPGDLCPLFDSIQRPLLLNIDRGRPLMVRGVKWLAETP